MMRLEVKSQSQMTDLNLGRVNLGVVHSRLIRGMDHIFRGVDHIYPVSAL